MSDSADGRVFTQGLDRLKESFLFAAAQGGNAADVQSLLEIGADIDWKGQGGDTPLLAACRRGHCETMALLAEHGSDVNSVGSDGMTCLHIAARRGDIASVNVLLEGSASLHMKDRDGKTALEVAKAKGHDDICKRLAQFRRTGLQAAGGTGGAEGAGPGPRSVLGSSSSTTAIPTAASAAAAAAAAIPAAASQPGPLGLRSPRRNLPALSGTSLSRSRPSSAVSLSSSAQDEAKESQQRLHLAAASSLDAALAAAAAPKTAFASASASGALPAAGSKETAPRPVAPPTQSYALIGQAYTDATTAALTKLLETETRERSRAEATVGALAEQNARLTNEITACLAEAQAARRECDGLQCELDLLKGRRAALEAPSVSLEVCAELERVLRISLDNVEARKSALVVEALEQQKEQRLCVICQEKDKSVVLLPCRHLCLCDVCSAHDDLAHCPLCRRPIAHRISVFS